MHNVFVARWHAFHAPIATAAHIMDMEFCQRKITNAMRIELYAVMKDFAKAPGSPSFLDMKSQYAVFESALGCKRVCVCVYVFVVGAWSITSAICAACVLNQCFQLHACCINVFN
jgi:hypothetical protein